MFMHFEEIAIVNHARNDIFHVIRLAGFHRNHGLKLGISTVNGVGALAARRIVEIIGGQKPKQFADHGQALGIVMRHKVRHAGSFIVRSCAPSWSLVTSSCVTVLITSGPVTNM